MVERPDGDLLESVIGCLEREDSEYGFDLGVRAVASIARGRSLDAEQWKRLQAIRPKLNVESVTLLDTLNPSPQPATQPAWMADFPRIIANVERFEGRTAYMYRSTGGMVCVGAGHAIPSAADAVKLAWWVGTRTAAQNEIEADYAAVSSAPTGLAATHYETLTKGRLNDEALNDLLRADVQRFMDQLAAALPKWHSYPSSAQAALFDMAFNLGINGVKRYEKMLAAIDAGDWEGAARESQRSGVPESRNEEIANLFREAGRPFFPG
jgi:GH24 family phage-related lysozyme (muramidase)